MVERTDDRIALRRPAGVLIHAVTVWIFISKTFAEQLNQIRTTTSDGITPDEVSLSITTARFLAVVVRNCRASARVRRRVLALPQKVGWNSNVEIPGDFCFGRGGDEEQRRGNYVSNADFHIVLRR